MQEDFNGPDIDDVMDPDQFLAHEWHDYTQIMDQLMIQP
jgi:hypothetical protein